MKINLFFVGAALALAINANVAVAADSTAYEFPAYGWAKPNGRLADGSSLQCQPGYVLFQPAGSSTYQCVNQVAFSDGTQAATCPSGSVLVQLAGSGTYACGNTIQNADNATTGQGVLQPDACAGGQYLGTSNNGTFGCNNVP